MTAQCEICGQFVGKPNIHAARVNGMFDPEEWEILCIDCWLKEYRPRFGPKLYEWRPEVVMKQNPMDVQCPKCKAGPNQSCRTGAGNVMTPHNPRFKEAWGEPPPPRDA